MGDDNRSKSRCGAGVGVERRVEEFRVMTGEEIRSEKKRQKGEYHQKPSDSKDPPRRKEGDTLPATKVDSVCTWNVLGLRGESEFLERVLPRQ